MNDIEHEQDYTVLCEQLHELSNTLVKYATLRRTARMEFESARAAFQLTEDALHGANFDYAVALDAFTNAINRAALT